MLGIAASELTKDELARALLACVPGQPAFIALARWMKEIDLAAK